MIFAHGNYRSYLKSVLVGRIQKNPAYSLRAMARDLGVNASQLSGIQNGKRGLSHALALQIAERLGLGADETEYFCLLVEYENARTPELKARYLEKIRQLHRDAPIKDMSVEIFKMMSEWYHIPIVEMTELRDFDLSPESAADRLGITKLEAEVAIERLVRIGLIERGSEGRFRKTEDRYNFNSNQPSSVLQGYHRKMLEKAIESLATQPPRKRYAASHTISIDESQFAEARARMDQFREDLEAFFDQGERRTQTYQLEMVFFNLTNGKGTD